MKVTLHEAAREELADAVNYYRHRSPGLADRLRRAVDETALVAWRHPYAGSEVRPGIRRILVPGFPYALIYRYEDSEAVVGVLAVMHDRRHPESWTGRL